MSSNTIVNGFQLLYQGAYSNVWAQPTLYQANLGSFTPGLLEWYDTVISEMKSYFGIDPPVNPNWQGRWNAILDPAAQGGAHTGTDSFGDGVSVSPDSVYGVYANIPGYWYYLLTMHESINDWTGKVAQNWVWADGWSGGGGLWKGSSPFPNACGIIISKILGRTDISIEQTTRMKDDLGVQLFLNIQSTYGWPVFEKLFSYIQSKGITNWAIYTEPTASNPTAPPMRTAVLCWILSCMCGVDLLAQFNAATTYYSGLVVDAGTYAQAQAAFPDLTLPAPVGFEIWDKTTGADARVAIGSDTAQITTNVGDLIAYKTPPDTLVAPRAPVDYYMDGKLIFTDKTNAMGYFELDSPPTGLPASYKGTTHTFYVVVDGARSGTITMIVN